MISGEKQVTDIATLEATKQPKKKYHIKRADIVNYLNRHHLRSTKVNLKKARAALRRRQDRQEAAVGKDISGSDPAADWQIIYGTMRVGGVHTFVHTINNNQYLLMVHTVAGHEVNAITKVFFDNEELTFPSVPGDASAPEKFNNKVYMQQRLGTAAQTALSQLVTDAPDKWTTNHKQSGRAHVYLKLHWDKLSFANGLPDIIFEVEGKKLYDPRSTTTSFSSNAALVIYDYLTDINYGLGIDSSEIDLTTFNAAADVCDEAVPVQAGGTEPRYTINGAFGASQSSKQILEGMLSSCSGYLSYVGGKYKLWVGEWRAPTITLTDADFLNDIQVQTKFSKRDSFNAIKGTYTSPKDNWEETDLPVVVNSYYQTQDGGERIFEDVSLPFVTSSATGQRLLKIELEKIRQSITIEVLCHMRAYQLEVADTVYVTLSRFGWSTKIFEVQKSELVIQAGSNGEPSMAVSLTLRETASAVYDWNSGQETQVDLAPNTNLPNPFSVGTPTGLTLESGTNQLYLRADGTVFSRIKVSWTTLSDFFVTSGGQIEIQYKQTVAVDWSNASPVPGNQTFTHILDVQDGASYDVRIRAVSALGVEGSYTTTVSHVVVGKTAAPSNVSGFTSIANSYGILLNWADIADFDLDKYEIRLGTAWATATLIAQIQGTSYLWEIQTAGVYSFLIKAIDTSGNYSTTETITVATIAAPSAPVIAFSIVQSNVILTWNEPSGQFAVNYYSISYGNAYSGSVAIGTAQTTTFSLQATWNGLRRFWIAAIDVAGNVGTPVSVDVNVTFPNAVSGLAADVIDNTVSLRWNAPLVPSTLPIGFYKVLKGSTFSSATINGQTAGTFTVILESSGGINTYWVVPVDTAGNEGIETPITVNVSQPPDFLLRDDQTLIPELFDTTTNILVGTMGSVFETFDPVTDTEITGCVLDLDSETNVTLDGSNLRRVSSWTDRSSYSLVGTQATAGLKPRQTRSDNSENRCLYSEDLSNSWTVTNTTIVANSTANPISGLINADKIQETVTISLSHSCQQTIPEFKNGKTYRFLGYFKSSGRNVKFQVNGGAFAATGVAADLSTGAIVIVYGSAANYTIVNMGSGWYRVSFEATATASGSTSLEILLIGASPFYFNNYVGDGSSGIFAWGIQAQFSQANDTYVYTQDGMELRGYNGKKGIWFEDTSSQVINFGATPAHLKFDTGDFTIFAVAAAHDTAKAGTNFDIINCEVFNTNGWLLRQDANASLNVHFRTNQAGVYTDVNYSSYTADVPMVYAVKKESTVGTPFLDNVFAGSGTINSPVTQTNDLTIGGDSQYYSGSIFRIIAYNKALTRLEIEKVAKWLQYKYQVLPEALSDDFMTGCFVGPVVLGQSYAQHFTTNAWADPDDQIAAGFPIYLQPSNGTAGEFEDKIDYGTILPSTIATISWVELPIAGSVTVQCDLSYSTDDVSYTTVTNTSQLFIQSFRYLKVKLKLTGGSTTALTEICNVKVVLNVKKKTDEGNITVSATDTSITATISIANPAVITAATHGLVEGQKIRFTTTGALPTGLAIATDYFVRNPSTNTFNVSTTPTGTIITTTGSQSGTHTIAAGGTWVSFNSTFLDIDAITGSPQGTTTPIVEVIDFADLPSPKGFNVYLFNSTTGARVSAIFRWTARGV